MVVFARRFLLLLSAAVALPAAFQRVPNAGLLFRPRKESLMAIGLGPWRNITALFLFFSLILTQNALAAQITAQPAQGPAGTSVMIIGTGWPPGDLIEFSWNFDYALTVARINADNTGAFTTVIVAPGEAQRATYVDAGDQAAFLTAQAPFTITSTAGFDDYPEPLCPPTPISHVVDPWNFFNRQCTSFVAWRLNRAYGFPAAFTNHLDPDRPDLRFSDAWQWYDAALNLFHIPADGNPVPGDVARFGKKTAGALEDGHVAWAKSVNSDNSITVEEYNRLGDGFYSRRNIPPSVVSQLHFIHFGDWFSTNLQSETEQPPAIVSHETFREGQLVFFRLFFTDPNNDAIGFGFSGHGWAKETHPFSSPSYGRMSGSTPVLIGDLLYSRSISIEYPFNLLCDTQSAYDSAVEAWIYDRAGKFSATVSIPLSCSAQGRAHVAQACTR